MPRPLPAPRARPFAPRVRRGRVAVRGVEVGCCACCRRRGLRSVRARSGMRCTLHDAAAGCLLLDDPLGWRAVEVLQGRPFNVCGCGRRQRRWREGGRQRLHRRQRTGRRVGGRIGAGGRVCGRLRRRQCAGGRQHVGRRVGDCLRRRLRRRLSRCGSRRRWCLLFDYGHVDAGSHVDRHRSAGRRDDRHRCAGRAGRIKLLSGYPQQQNACAHTQPSHHFAHHWLSRFTSGRKIVSLGRNSGSVRLISSPFRALTVASAGASVIESTCGDCAGSALFN